MVITNKDLPVNEIGQCIKLNQLAVKSKTHRPYIVSYNCKDCNS